VKDQLRRTIPVIVVAVVVLAAGMLALALSASPAAAFSQWQHDGAIGCESCHNTAEQLTDATCTNCHAGFQSYPGSTCWSCHAPGQDTSTLSTPSSACSQECHLWNAFQKQYITPSTHGANPHLGASPDCLGCHPTSVSVVDPGSSPHHSGQATGFTQCGVCHSSPQRHAGRVACTRCHTTAAAFHVFQANSPGYRQCGSCHTMRHAGKKVATRRCAACHKGGGGRTVQHASSITKRFVCSGCHSKKLHARSVSKAVKSCRTCHKNKFHARQPNPAKSVCLRCHGATRRHDNGFQCTLCHRRAVHAARPSAVN
jgi:hypothetical protein